MHASDTNSDITVHYDITGIQPPKEDDRHHGMFQRPPAKHSKLIVQNSNLPRKHQEISRLLAEYSRYQGYDNKAVAIGLVNEPATPKTAI